jgi:uncharacterized protein with PIN domain
MLAYILRLLAGITEYFRDKQLLDAGKAEERVNVDKAQREAVAKTKEIVQEVKLLDNNSLDSQLYEFTRKDK